MVTNRFFSDSQTLSSPHALSTFVNGIFFILLQQVLYLHWCACEPGFRREKRSMGCGDLATIFHHPAPILLTSYGIFRWVFETLQRSDTPPRYSFYKALPHCTRSAPSDSQSQSRQKTITNILKAVAHLAIYKRIILTWLSIKQLRALAILYQ